MPGGRGNGSRRKARKEISFGRSNEHSPGTPQLSMHVRYGGRLMNITQTAKVDLAQFGTLFKTDPANLSDQELLSLDFLLHRVAAIASEEHPVFLEGEGWTHQDVVRLHDKVREEMAARGYRHTIEDPLTAACLPLQAQKESTPPAF